MSLTLDGIRLQQDGQTWLDDIRLVLEPGQLYVLLGRTGAGKTTLLRTMAGLLRPDRGRLSGPDGDLTGVPVRRRDIAFVYQQFVNYPSFTVRDNIAAPLRRQAAPRAEIARKVAEMARMVHIDHLLDRLPQQLSGGQQQRVAIARALVKGAGLLLLDEPLVNLDYKLREELRADLRGIFRSGRATVVYSTTEPDEALQMGGTTIVMDEGRILQMGPAASVHAAPVSVTAAGILYDPPMNVIAGRIEGGTLAFGGNRVALPQHMAGQPPGPCRLGIAPHRIQPARPGDAAALTGRVDLCEVDGSSTFVHFACDGQDWVMKRDGVHPLPGGSGLSVRIDAQDFFLFDAAGRLAAPPGPARREAA